MLTSCLSLYQLRKWPEMDLSDVISPSRYTDTDTDKLIFAQHTQIRNKSLIQTVSVHFLTLKILGMVQHICPQHGASIIICSSCSAIHRGSAPALKYSCCSSIFFSSLQQKAKKYTEAGLKPGSKKTKVEEKNKLSGNEKQKTILFSVSLLEGKKQQLHQYAFAILFKNNKLN